MASITGTRELQRHYINHFRRILDEQLAKAARGVGGLPDLVITRKAFTEELFGERIENDKILTERFFEKYQDVNFGNLAEKIFALTKALIQDRYTLGWRDY